jgi:hypothetical protein
MKDLSPLTYFLGLQVPYSFSLVLYNFFLW